MSAAVVVGIGLLGGVGAIARFVLDGSVAARVGRDFPYGTLVVNVLGSLLLGVLVGAAVGDSVNRLAGSGLLGGFTTFSTWALESHRLGEDGRLRSGVANFAVSLALGVLAAWAAASASPAGLRSGRRAPAPPRDRRRHRAARYRRHGARRARSCASASATAARSPSRPRSRTTTRQVCRHGRS